jgi:hypothetical protein
VISLIGSVVPIVALLSVQRAQIPIVTTETIDAIPNNSLVTYVGMVQDMFNPEYFVSEYRDTEGVWQTTRYGDCCVDDGACESQSERRFDERHPVLVVPVPGRSSWLEEREREAATASVAQFGGHLKHGHGKRPLNADSMEVDPSVGLSGEAGVEPGAAAGQVASLNEHGKDGGGMYDGGNDFGSGIKRMGAEPSGRAPGQTRTVYPSIPPGSCVVHMYNDGANDDGRLKLNDVVQVLGVISRVPELASGAMHGMEDEDEAALASKIPTSVAPRIHAISARKLDLSSLAGITPSLPITPSPRQSIVAFLSEALLGDTLAAEYVLMLLVSRVHRRMQGGIGGIGGMGQDTQAQLGTAALNITGMDQSTGQGAGALAQALSLLMPSVVSLPLDIDMLNKQPWYPTKVQNASSGHAILQLPAGTVLLLDELAMTAGQLTETGLKNLGAIQTIMRYQKLPYDFQFYQLEQPTDQPIIITSVGKTMLKGAGEIHVPLVKGSAVHSDGTQGSFKGDIDAARQYLVSARSVAFAIPQELEKQIENDMTEARKKDSANVTAETFHSWLNLARLLCLSHGETELSLDRWRQVLAMEAERLKRIPN